MPWFSLGFVYAFFSAFNYFRFSFHMPHNRIVVWMLFYSFSDALCCVRNMSWCLFWVQSQMMHNFKYLNVCSWCHCARDYHHCCHGYQCGHIGVSSSVSLFCWMRILNRKLKIQRANKSSQVAQRFKFICIYSCTMSAAWPKWKFIILNEIGNWEMKYFLSSYDKGSLSFWSFTKNTWQK